MTVKSKSRWLVILIIVSVSILFVPVTAAAEKHNVNFVALGDSNAFGLSAFHNPYNRDLTTLNGYNDQFAASLGVYGTKNYENFAWPGDKTSDLLNKLYDETTAMAVGQADIITVGIGGNNLLGPSIAAITGLWGVDPSEYPGDLDGRNMISALAEAIVLEYAADTLYDPMDDFMRLMDPSDPAGKAFQAALTQGMIDFHVEWPVIAQKIRGLNPRAELYVNTVHNPIQIDNPNDLGDPLVPLYLQMESLIGSFNRTIESYSRMYRYQIVDVKTVFEMTPGSLTFDIAGALTTAGMIAEYILIGADPDQILILQLLQQTDPHPTYIGHVAAYELLVEVRETRKPARPMWPARSPRSPRSPVFGWW